MQVRGTDGRTGGLKKGRGGGHVGTRFSWGGVVSCRGGGVREGVYIRLGVRMCFIDQITIGRTKANESADVRRVSLKQFCVCPLFPRRKHLPSPTLSQERQVDDFRQKSLQQ